MKGITLMYLGRQWEIQQQPEKTVKGAVVTLAALGPVGSTKVSWAARSLLRGGRNPSCGHHREAPGGTGCSWFLGTGYVTQSGEAAPQGVKGACRAVPCHPVMSRAVPCRAVPSRAMLCCPVPSAVPGLRWAQLRWKHPEFGHRGTGGRGGRSTEQVLVPDRQGPKYCGHFYYRQQKKGGFYGDPGGLKG